MKGYAAVSAAALIVDEGKSIFVVKQFRSRSSAVKPEIGVRVGVITGAGMSVGKQIDRGIQRVDA